MVPHVPVKSVLNSESNYGSYGPPKSKLAKIVLPVTLFGYIFLGNGKFSLENTPPGDHFTLVDFWSAAPPWGTYCSVLGMTFWKS